MSLAFLFLSFALPISAVAQNATANTNATNTEPAFSGWVSGSNDRGTFDLLLGSLTTLSLCAWTAYHPNIHPRFGHVKAFLSRISWMLVVVLAPELVLFFAWKQRKMAKNLRDEINKIQKLDPSRPTTAGSGNAVALASLPDSSRNASPPEHSPPKLENKASFIVQPTKWTLEHGFFAISGGLAVDTSSFWPRPIMVFTPDGVLELAKRGLLPDIPLEAVEDKSKTDSIGKILVCVQAAWFSAQVIARLVQGLPVTLLEVHVLAHVVCAFAMYFVWFKKPYDAHEPILCTDERVVNLASLFIVDTKAGYRYFDSNPDDSTTANGNRDVVDIREIRGAHATARSSIAADTTIEVIRKHIDNYDPYRNRVDLNDFADGVWDPKKSELDQAKIANHFKRAQRGLTYVKANQSTSLTPDETELTTWYHKLYLVPFRSNIRIQGSEELRELSNRRSESRTLLLSWTFSLLGAVYGGVHLSTWAWTDLFPSTAELWCWRASGIAIAAGPFLLTLCVSLLELGWKVSHRPNNWVGAEKAARRLCGWSIYSVDFIIALLWSIVCVVYPIGRAYVLVEAFASLRRTPNGTYTTVDWTGFIPHVG